MIQCGCGHWFEPDPISLKAWAESGNSFDPTDFICPSCEVAYENWVAAQQAGAADHDPGAQSSTVDEDRNSESRGG